MGNSLSTFKRSRPFDIGPNWLYLLYTNSIMEKKLDKFIVSIRTKEKPFVYKKPILDRYFMLSYDESIDELDDDDFRPYIIAALHAKGASELKSYVASTIIFKAQATKGDSHQAMKNWKKYLVDVFGKEIVFMLGMTMVYTNTQKPILIKVPDKSIELQFDTWVKKVKDKFRTLK